MLKKHIKVLIVLSVFVFSLPNISLALDKEEFLKLLINGSYPEVKTEENNKNNKVKENTQEKNSEEYIKFHVGEENIPTVNKNNKKEDKNGSEEKDISTSGYINNTRVTKENPQILLYHSHAGETYSDSPEGNYHSKEKKKSVLEVGTLVTDELSKKGWGVVHSIKYHDYPSFNESYASSKKTIQEMLPKYESIDIAIDLHRDAREIDTSEKLEAERKRMTTVYNGEPVAKFFFVVGMKNENLNEVRALAEDITKFAQEKYPELIRPVVENKYGTYNQSMANNHVLIEVGSNGTTSEEAQNSAKYIAQILDEYFKTR